MVSDYFKGESTESSGGEQHEGAQAPEEAVKDFSISTDKYSKSKMKIEIVEYEIKY